MAPNATRSYSCTRQWKFLGSTPWRSAKPKAHTGSALARQLHERTAVCQIWIAIKTRHAQRRPCVSASAAFQPTQFERPTPSPVAAAVKNG
jgi:hypothetical protein